MSQLDKLTFLPHLFWFVLFFGLFYFLIFSFILPLIFQSLKIRELFFLSIVSTTIFTNTFYFVIFCTTGATSWNLFIKSFFIGLYNFYNLSSSNYLFISESNYNALYI